MAQVGNSEIVATDPTTQLRAAIAQNAAIYLDLLLPEAIAAGRTCRCLIRGISVVSVENVGWEFWFFSKRRTTTPPGPIDSENLLANGIAFLGHWTFTQAMGLRIGAAGNYYYYIDDLEIPYVVTDLLADGQPDDAGWRRYLHVAVIARTVGKSADDAGAVRAQFILEPSLGW